MSLHTLMFGWEYPPHHMGGLGVACQGIVRGLRHHGVRVTLVLPHANDEEDDIRSPTETHVKNIRVPSSLQPYDSAESFQNRCLRLPKELGDLYGEDIGQAVETLTQLSVEMTKDLTPNIVHCHDWMTYRAGVSAARFHRTPLVAHIHATELDRTDFNPNQWIYDQERRGFEQADNIIAVSAYTKNMLIRHYGINPDKIIVVHNASDQPPAGITSQYPIKHIPLVMFLGRLATQKNPWQFLEVARRIHEHRSDVHFVVAGDGPDFGTLISRTCELGLADRVLFTGKLHDAEIHTLFERASCFVMPSLSEPFGLVALEAVSHGVPVILSKQSGVTEVLRHCFTVDFWDTEKMADCILTILRDEPLALQLTSEATRSLSHLTWERQTGMIRDIYTHLLSPH